MKNYFTSESISEGHPDKICDQISDAILIECLKQDKNSRVACECFITTDYLLIGGEITTKAKVNYEKVARDVLLKIGYNDNKLGIDGNTCQVDIKIKEQSPDISMGVNKEEMGAGDQGIMFGYACNETTHLMPYPISMAHDLVHLASKLRKKGNFKWARPDMKSQVTIDYTNPKNPSIDTMLMSIQHDENYNKEEFQEFIKKNIMQIIAKKYNLNTDFKVLINPTGRFTIGGPASDAGLTGRKIIADTYGGMSRHGGGAFSGKDPSKVDRSAAYMCRYIAKNIVSAGLAEKIEIQVSYAIGMPEPISIFVEAFNTNKISLDKLTTAIKETFDLSVSGIINSLNLLEQNYFRASKYGHFGKNEFSWEKLDKVNKLKEYL